MKGLFIPEITAEMFRNGCLESIEALMTEGEIYDIDYSPWIPCSERLPEDDGEYLAWVQWEFDEEPSYSIIHYDSGAEAFGEWHEYFDYHTLGSLGSDFKEIKGVIAWMPLPEPYNAERRGGINADDRRAEKAKSGA